MSRTRISVAVLVLVAGGAVSVSVGAQDVVRPNFSGKWTPVPEKSQPPQTQPISSVTIVQDGQKFTVTPTAGAAAGTATPEPVSNTYLTDDVERELADLKPKPTQQIGPLTAATTQTYQAVWNKDQLVITFRLTRVTTMNGREQKSVTVNRRVWSLDSDGFLISETGLVRSTPPPAATLRIVYRKAATELEGEWVGQSIEREGKPILLPSNTMTARVGEQPTYLPREWRLTVRGDKFIRKGWANRDGSDELEHQFEIDSSTTPKGLLLKNEGKVITSASFDLVADTLRIAFPLPPAERPKSITSANGTVWVLTRSK